jgi:hypothetical protein
MASHVQVANLGANSFAGLSAKKESHFLNMVGMEANPLKPIPPVSQDSVSEGQAPRVIAQGVEFVALPEKAERLQAAIPKALKSALGGSRTFSGCMVLVSEQESRLVTVITLWAGTDRAKECNEKSSQVKRLLTPYVDRWLRTRRLAAFLSVP